MERWNELIAGYVLGNLTDDEAQELSAILQDHPHLRLEISRLRKTATMSRSRQADWPLEPLDAGAEGWTDTVHDLSDVQSIQPAFPEKKPLLESMTKPIQSKPDGAAESAFSLRQVLSRRLLLNRPVVESFVPERESVFQRKSLLSWLMALVLIGVGIDNWRVRRLLSIAQERISQLELSAEYRPGSAE